MHTVVLDMPGKRVSKTMKCQTSKSKAAKPRVSKVEPSQPQSRKRTSTSPCFPVAKRRALLSAVSEAEHVPPCVREMLSTWSGRLPELQEHEEAMSELGAVLNSIDDTQQQHVCELQQVVDEVETEKVARDAAEIAAAAEVARLKQTVLEKKAALQNLSKEITAAREALAGCKDRRKSEALALRQTAKKVDRLETTRKNVYEPLKEAQARGKQLNTKMKDLRKIGKEFAFHDVLLEAMPSILKKQLDRRQTFDKVAIQQFDAEFTKRLTELETITEDGEVAFESTHSAVQTAQEELQSLKRQQDDCSRELAVAEADFADSIAALAGAKQKVRQFPSDSKKATDALCKAQAQLSTFREGPLGAYEQLVIEASASGSQCEALQAIASEENAALECAGSFNNSKVAHAASNQEVASGPVGFICTTQEEPIEPTEPEVRSVAVEASASKPQSTLLHAGTSEAAVPMDIDVVPGASNQGISDMAVTAVGNAEAKGGAFNFTSAATLQFLPEEAEATAEEMHVEVPREESMPREHAISAAATFVVLPPTVPGIPETKADATNEDSRQAGSNEDHDRPSLSVASTLVDTSVTSGM